MKINGLSLELISPALIAVNIENILSKDFSAIEDSPNSSRFNVPYNFNILGYNEESEEEDILIGTIEGAMIISTFIYDWEDEDIVNEFDKISDENVELHKIICKNVKNLDYISDEDFYYVARIEIKKEYRNHGIGCCMFPLILETFEKYLQIGLSCIMLKAFPLEYIGKYDENNTIINKEIEIAEKRLFDFYERVGFKKIDKDKNFMVYRNKRQ